MTSKDTSLILLKSTNIKEEGQGSQQHVLYNSMDIIKMQWLTFLYAPASNTS